jgi:hypothetical protein
LLRKAYGRKTYNQLSTLLPVPNDNFFAMNGSIAPNRHTTVGISRAYKHRDEMVLDFDIVKPFDIFLIGSGSTASLGGVGDFGAAHCQRMGKIGGEGAEMKNVGVLARNWRSRLGGGAKDMNLYILFQFHNDHQVLVRDDP